MKGQISRNITFNERKYFTATIIGPKSGGSTLKAFTGKVPEQSPHKVRVLRRRPPHRFSHTDNALGNAPAFEWDLGLVVHHRQSLPLWGQRS